MQDSTRLISRSALLVLTLTAVTLALPASGAGSAEPTSTGENAAPPSYDQGVKLLAAGNVERARRAFDRANRKKPNDPEILNMLAYAQRKTGDLEEAIKNYKRALRIRPDFPDAREYLGEAYLQAAYAELDWLANAGEAGKRQHEQLLQAIHDRSLGPPPPSQKSRW